MSNSVHNNQNNSPFIVIIGLIISIGRIILGSINDGTDYSKIILAVMAIVNYIALGFVLLFLYNDFYSFFKNRLDNSGLTTKEKKNSYFTSHFISFILLLGYFLTGYFYITKYYNSNTNDAISVFALSVSIANDGLVEKYGILFYKMINKISKLKK